MLLMIRVTDYFYLSLPTYLLNTFNEITKIKHLIGNYRDKVDALKNVPSNFSPKQVNKWTGAPAVFLFLFCIALLT